MAIDRGLRVDDDRREDARARPGRRRRGQQGVEHELIASDDGVTFFEALAPVPLDHVPDRERDLVLAEGGAAHVAR